MECSSPPKSEEDIGSVLSSSCRDWTAMPLGVLGDITKVLPPIDQCRFRAVCHRWNEAALSIMQKCKTNRSGICGGEVDAKKEEVEVVVAKRDIDYHPYGGRQRSPWLMLPVKKGKGTHHGFCSLAQVEAEGEESPSSSCGGNYFFRLSYLPSIGYVAGTSPGGWILHVDDYGELHALNIFSLVEIDAPPLSTFSGLLEIHRDDEGRATSYTSTNIFCSDWLVRNYKPSRSTSFYYQALIFFFPSSLPTSSSKARARQGQGRYLFVVIRGAFKELAYAWEGDKTWTDLDPQHKIGFFRNLIMHNGLIYAIASGCFGSSFAASFDPTVGFESFNILDAPFYHTTSTSADGDPFRLLGTSYIVEISDELWVINRDLWPSNQGKRGRARNGRRDMIDTDMPYLFRLDKEANKWIEVHDGFGEGFAMFLGTNQSLVLSTSEFPHLKSGCIYFTDNAWDYYHLPSPDRDVGVFDFTTKTFHFDCHWRPNGNNFPSPIWLLR